jgi:DNA-binding MarR family transcriptional regulator
MSRPGRRRATRPGPDLSAARAGHDLALGLRAAYLTMHRRANAVFARFGLTADQFVLLTALAEGDGVTQKELVRRANSDPNTVSEMLGRLERRGLILRERHADDGRALQVSLTEAGRAAQRRAMEGSASLREALASLVPADELGTLLDHLNRIADMMSATDSPPIPDTGATPATHRGANGAHEGGTDRAARGRHGR